MLNVISLGAGVQSSTMSLMAAHGEITPMPDAAIFADTKAEPRAVYQWLDWLTPRLPFPVYRVCKREGLLVNIVQPLRRGRRASAPFYTRSAEGVGALRRQCTSAFKAEPINHKLRELLSIRPRQRSPKSPAVTLWLGISLDEAYRMRDSTEPWIEHRYPLVFDVPMKRHDCLTWMERHDYPRPPRSACVFCPYRSDAEWRALRDSDSEGWQTAQGVDELIRAGVRGDPRPLYVHRTCRPLGEVDLSTPQDHGQLELWSEVCDGLCGV